MSPTSQPFLAKILTPFHHRRQSEHPTSLQPQQAVDSYVPTWQREGASVDGTRPTGRRKPSTSAAGDEDESRRRRQRAVSEPGGGMLYFGEGGGDTRHQQSNSGSSNNNNNTHLCPPGVWSHKPGASSSSSRPRAKTGAAAPGTGTGPAFASGRDASGNLRTGVNSTSIMTGTYASLTYGGSVRF